MLNQCNVHTDMARTLVYACGKRRVGLLVHFSLLIVQEGKEVVEQVIGYKKKPLEEATAKLASLK
jgi:hypothetical protein